MVLLLPLLSFLIGYFATQYLQAFRPMMAAVLARVLIPMLIVYHMVFYQEGSVWLIGLSVLSSIILFSFFYYLQKDKLRALCFSYLNGAWLGFPLALAVFGSQAMSTMVALYIGASLFGNVVAVMALNDQKQHSAQSIKNILLSPPIVALSIAGCLSFWDFAAYQQHWMIESLYQFNKILVTFTGMCILGMWLNAVRINVQDLKTSAYWLAIRSCLALVLSAVAYVVLPLSPILFTCAVILLFFLLPPAANIVALETHYLGTGHSAKYIASGTLMSLCFIAVYAVVLHVSHIL